jgi:17beta-estradiol 17-dehydrogenase / very-long-chain 3-oxoacyl-CoA reductase
MIFFHDVIVNIVTAVGAVYLVRLLWTLIAIFYRFIAYTTDWKKWGAGGANWAVVTGATDGIGREYALQLAKKGFSILIVGRSVDKLKEVTQEIAAAGGKSEELVIDFSKVNFCFLFFFSLFLFLVSAGNRC